MKWMPQGLATGLLMTAIGCAHHEPLSTPDSVDLDRFMGLWYVQGYTPILVDHDAHNAVEHYALKGDGKIATTYQFRKGGSDGKLKTMTPVGEVYNKESRAEWRMQFIWPFKAPYVIHHLSPDYESTIIAHPNRKYAWIMHRNPKMEPNTYQSYLDMLQNSGFDPARIEKVPHNWSGESSRIQEYSFLRKSAVSESQSEE